MPSLCKRLGMGAVKGLSSLALGGAILWQVHNQCCVIKSVAYVHVPTPAVDITVDDQTYRVETLWDSPIVCELPPGLHLLRMMRNKTVIFEQEFTLSSGQEVVLTAWEGFKANPAEELPPNVAFNPSLPRSRFDGKNP